MGMGFARKATEGLMLEKNPSGVERGVAGTSLQEALNHFMLFGIERFSLRAEIQEIAVFKTGAPSWAATLPFLEHLLAPLLYMGRSCAWLWIVRNVAHGRPPANTLVSWSVLFIVSLLSLRFIIPHPERSPHDF